MSTLINPQTLKTMSDQADSSAHAFLLIGQSGIGKSVAIEEFGGLRLGLSSSELAAYPYLKRINSQKGKSISIDSVRDLEQFLSKRVPGNQKRLILIENAQDMTVEAQNALLKSLEEPPAGTSIIMSATHREAVLPTILSRAAVIPVLRPADADIESYFTQQGFTSDAIHRASNMSGGLPGLMQALLTDNDSHPLMEAASLARACIQQPTFGRLAMIDALAKDKVLSENVLALFQQMAHVSLKAGNTNPLWKPLLVEAYEAQQLLRQNAQPKLVLTNLMLRLAI